MTTIDKSGTSVEEIIRAFRTEHKIQDWELKYNILKKPFKGFFGLFASNIALVRFQLPSIEDRARMYTESLLSKMGIGFDSITGKYEGKTLYLDIHGCKDPGFMIGKNGSMLETIQYLVNRVFEYDRKLERIYLDADGYRERKEASFYRQFKSLIDKIKVHGKPLTLDPMTAAERRIIHRNVERDKGLSTLTIGEGELKRIVIFSSKQSEREALNKSKAEDTTPAQKDKTPEKRKPNTIVKPKTPTPKTETAKPVAKTTTMKPNTNKPNPSHHKTKVADNSKP